MTETVTRWQQAKAVERETAKRLNRIIVMGNLSEQRAILAKLRRGIGHQPGEQPDLWSILLDGLPESMESAQTGEPTFAEWAIFAALTVFAQHQQGRDPKHEPMHVRQISLGKAADMLAKALPGNSADNHDRISRRFNQIATADSMEELTHYLRGLVQMLRANHTPLDYAMLAGDLFRYQFDDLASDVRLKWGEDFYSGSTEDKEETEDA